MDPGLKHCEQNYILLTKAIPHKKTEKEEMNGEILRKLDGQRVREMSTINREGAIGGAEVDRQIDREIMKEKERNTDRSRERERENLRPQTTPETAARNYGNKPMLWC